MLISRRGAIYPKNWNRLRQSVSRLSMESDHHYPRSSNKRFPCILSKAGPGHRYIKSQMVKSTITLNSDDAQDWSPPWNHSDTSSLNLSPSEAELLGASTQVAKDKRAPRKYAPGYRSGAFGLLIALHLATTSQEQDFLTKEQLIINAQEFCTASYRTPAHGKHSAHTAWNGMATLMAKELVMKDGTPSKYYLTLAGQDLAQKLWQKKLLFEENASVKPSASAQTPNADASVTTESNLSTSSPCLAAESSDFPLVLTSNSSTALELRSTQPPPPRQLPIDHTNFLQIENACRKKRSGTSANVENCHRRNTDSITAAPPLLVPKSPLPLVCDIPSLKSFYYCYLNAGGKRVLNRDESKVLMCDGKRWFRILYSASQSSHPATFKLRSASLVPDSDGFLVGYLHESISSPVVPSVEPSITFHSVSDEDQSSNMENELFHSSSHESAQFSELNPTEPSPNLITCDSIHAPLTKDFLQKLPSFSTPPFTLYEPIATISINRGCEELKSFDSACFSNSSIDSGPNSCTDFPPSAFFNYPPNSFEIVLLVDTREVRAKNDRDYLCNELRRRGVACECRMLELGDMMWIARKNGIYDEEEIVLDYIVERKRLDDLVASVKDGRFGEQKVRSEVCG